MDLQATIIAIYLAIALILLAVALFVRDWLGGRQTEASLSAALGKLPHAPEFAPPGIIAKLDFYLNRLMAGTGWDLSAEGGVILLLSCGVAVGGGVFLWKEEVPAALAAGTAGVVGGLLILLLVRARRMRLVREQLPDVIEVLARAVRAGESLDQAIALVAETTPEPLGPEFRRCSGQLAMGLSLSSAMRGLSRRMPIMDLRILTAALVVQRQAGGNLPITLERLARVVRDRLSFFRQLRAATGASRLGTVLIALAGPLVALYLLNYQHEYLARFWELPHGLWLLGVAGILEAIGLIWTVRVFRGSSY